MQNWVNMTMSMFLSTCTSGNFITWSCPERITSDEDRDVNYVYIHRSYILFFGQSYFEEQDFLTVTEVNISTTYIKRK